MKGEKSAPPTMQLGLFSAPFENLPLRDAIDFYKHEKGWSNRLIAGDSLLVMNSLLQKEGMAGQVQMIYIDPPYGIRYGSNFQPFVGKREVKDRADEDLTQEPEMIKAFRDTWELGIHSYLTYLRDRAAARERAAQLSLAACSSRSPMRTCTTSASSGRRVRVATISVAQIAVTEDRRPDGYRHLETSLTISFGTRSDARTTEVPTAISPKVAGQRGTRTSTSIRCRQSSDGAHSAELTRGRAADVSDDPAASTSISTDNLDVSQGFQSQHDRSVSASMGKRVRPGPNA